MRLTICAMGCNGHQRCWYLSCGEPATQIYPKKNENLCSNIFKYTFAAHIFCSLETDSSRWSDCCTYKVCWFVNLSQIGHAVFTSPSLRPHNTRQPVKHLALVTSFQVVSTGCTTTDYSAHVEVHHHLACKFK